MEHINYAITREGKKLAESVYEEMLKDLNLPKKGVTAGIEVCYRQVECFSGHQKCI